MRGRKAKKNAIATLTGGGTGHADEHGEPGR